MKFTRLSGLLLAAALTIAVPGMAGASPDTSLKLTIVADNGDYVSVDLACDPPEGSHPDAKRACGELLAARGDFAALPGDGQDMMCTMEYRPVTAIAEGTWSGDSVDWKHEFGNSCTLHTTTGTVFRF